jgi:hypothetical protein
MTGMPSWDGTLTDEQIWKTILFIKHSNALPPDVEMAWQEIATPASTTEPVQQATPPTPKPPSKH